MPETVMEMGLTRQRVVKVIPPRANARDALAVEALLAALTDLEPFSLEIAGTPTERSFQVRGEATPVGRVLAQLRDTYPQCEWEDLTPETDPAGTPARVRLGVELRLREGAHLPLRTHLSREGHVMHDDYARGADPMIGLLAAMEDLQPGEACLAQFVLQPMPGDWSKYWRGASRDLGERMKVTPEGLGVTLLSALGPALVGFGLLFLLIAAVGSAEPGFWLFALGWVIAGAAALTWRFRLPSSPDPQLVSLKVNQTAFRVWARVFAWADSRAGAAMRLEQLKSAFRVYNLAGGNGFVFVDLPIDLRPQTLDVSGDPFRTPLLLAGVVRKPWQQPSVLSVSEVAALWHLPHGEAGLQGVAYTSSRRLAPLPGVISDGVWIGRSIRQGRSVPVRLARAALNGNIGLIAKTQSGKSNLMALLTADVVANDPSATVIVLDPHRTLAQQVAALVPVERRDQAIYWSLADRERPFGLNLIDRMPRGGTGMGGTASASDLFTDKRISDIIDAFREIWPDNWGPRMEDYLRGPLLTLASANESMIGTFLFDEWRREASATFAALRQQLRRGQMDSQVAAMLLGTLLQFRRLGVPARPSREKAYRLLAPLYDAFEQAHKGVLHGEAGAHTLRLEALRHLEHVLCDCPSDNGRDNQPTGLAERVYLVDGLPHPLQFTLLDVNPILMSAALRATALSGLRDETHWHIKDWWRDSYDAYLKLNSRLLLDMITPVTKKMNRFSSSDVARRIFGQPESTIDLERIIREGGILLIDLSAGVVGQETAALIGSTLLNWVASILFAQQEHAQERRRVFIVIDEFQSIPGADYTFMLSELAKYGAQLCMGTQSLRLLDQVNKKARAAWLDNTSTVFAFRCGAEDAHELARELGIADEDRLTVLPSDIVGLPDYACFVRTRDDRHQPAVFRVDTRKVDAGDPQAFATIREASRQTYGRDATQVDAWLRLASSFQGAPDMVGTALSGYRSPVDIRATVTRRTLDPSEAYAEHVEPEVDRPDDQVQVE